MQARISLLKATKNQLTIYNPMKAADDLFYLFFNVQREQSALIKDISKSVKHKYTSVIKHLWIDSLYQNKLNASIGYLPTLRSEDRKQFSIEQLQENCRNIEARISKCQQLFRVKGIKQRPSCDHLYYNLWLKLQQFVFRHFQRMVIMHSFSADLSFLNQATKSLEQLNNRIKEQGRRIIAFRWRPSPSSLQLQRFHPLRQLFGKQKRLIAQIIDTIQQEQAKIKTFKQSARDLMRLDVLIQHIMFRFECDTRAKQSLTELLQRLKLKYK